MSKLIRRAANGDHESKIHDIISADIIPAPSEASVHREAYHVDRHGILITNKHIADILRAAAAEDTSALC